MSAITAIRLWTLLAILGGLFSLVGLVFSSYGLRVAWRRWNFQGTEGIVAKRDIFMLGSFVVESVVLLGTAMGLIYLSFQYPQDLYPILEILAIPVFACYLGFTVGVGLSSIAGPIWVLSRIWAIREYHGGK